MVPCRYYPFNPVDDIEIYRDKVKHWISNYESDSYFHWDAMFDAVSSMEYRPSRNVSPSWTGTMLST